MVLQNVLIVVRAEFPNKSKETFRSALQNDEHSTAMTRFGFIRHNGESRLHVMKDNSLGIHALRRDLGQ